MKIHEHQAKSILKNNYGLRVQDGVVVDSKANIEAAIDEVERLHGAGSFVVKAQVHAGGRGKGGGVEFSPSKKDAVEAAERILGMRLVTPQTTKDGVLVRRIMIAEAINIDQEFYLAITLDRTSGKDVVIASKEGGMDIEEVAEENPNAILKERIEPSLGSVQGFQANRIAKAFHLPRTLYRSFAELLGGLYRAYLERDMGLLEVNPLVLSKEGELVVLDAKVSFDENALFRQEANRSLEDPSEEAPAEVEAKQHGLSFITLDGTVGCMVNGAGLAMATMDLIKLQGAEPANFLDVGGGANEQSVEQAFRLILLDEKVRAILINIFGGIVRCDRVAKGVLAAMNSLQVRVPVVVRLAGTNVELARELLNDAAKEEQSPITFASSLEEAAKKVVALL